MQLGDDRDWSRVELLLLRADTLLNAAADTLDRRQEQRRRDRERIASGLDDLHGPLAQLRLDLIGLVEEMAAEGAQGDSLPWQGRLQEQLPRLERVLMELERLLVQVADPADPGDGDPVRPRLVHLDLAVLLEQRNQQLSELRAEVERLEGIVRAAGLSPAPPDQERGSM